MRADTQEAVRECIKELGVRETARKLGVHHETVRKWAAGEADPSDTNATAARQLAVDLLLRSGIDLGEGSVLTTNDSPNSSRKPVLIHDGQAYVAMDQIGGEHAYLRAMRLAGKEPRPLLKEAITLFMLTAIGLRGEHGA